MQQRTKHLLKGSFFATAIIITVAIAYLSLMKVPQNQPIFKISDKILHAVAYFVLTFSWLLAFYKKKTIKHLLIAGCVFYGILLEVLQGTLTDYRYAEYLDMVANTIGVLLALIVFNKLLEKK